MYMPYRPANWNAPLKETMRCGGYLRRRMNLRNDGRGTLGTLLSVQGLVRNAGTENHGWCAREAPLPTSERRVSGMQNTMARYTGRLVRDRKPNTQRHLDSVANCPPMRGPRIGPS